MRVTNKFILVFLFALAVAGTVHGEDEMYFRDNESNVGMYHPNGDYLIANKAYVKLENPMGAPAGYLFVSRQNSSAAVEEVVIEQEATEEVIYDLMGRRVVNPTRGIYIVNGKKVFIQ